MASDSPNTINLKGIPTYAENETDEALFPGHLVSLKSNGRIEKQGVNAGNCRRAFVLENDLIGGDINDEYAVGERVRYGIFRPGDIVYARVRAGAGAIAIGDKLQSHTDGTVKKATNEVNIIGFALSSLDNSGGTSETFVTMEVN